MAHHLVINMTSINKRSSAGNHKT